MGRTRFCDEKLIQLKDVPEGEIIGIKEYDGGWLKTNMKQYEFILVVNTNTGWTLWLSGDRKVYGSQTATSLNPPKFFLIELNRLKNALHQKGFWHLSNTLDIIANLLHSMIVYVDRGVDEESKIEGEAYQILYQNRPPKQFGIKRFDIITIMNALRMATPLQNTELISLLQRIAKEDEETCYNNDSDHDKRLHDDQCESGEKKQDTSDA